MSEANKGQVTLSQIEAVRQKANLCRMGALSARRHGDIERQAKLEQQCTEYELQVREMERQLGAQTVGGEEERERGDLDTVIGLCSLALIVFVLIGIACAGQALGVW